MLLTGAEGIECAIREIKLGIKYVFSFLDISHTDRKLPVFPGAEVNRTENSERLYVFTGALRRASVGWFCLGHGPWSNGGGLLCLIPKAEPQDHGPAPFVVAPRVSDTGLLRVLTAPLYLFRASSLHPVL